MHIGFYHDYAGTRHAGGIAIYTQQIAAALSRSHDVYLYTQRGDLSPVLTDSDVTVVETESFDERYSERLASLTPVSSQIQTKLLMTYWAARNDVIDHIDDHLDVLFTFQFLDDLLMSNLVDVPTVYTFHRLSDVGIGALARERFSQTEFTLANSDDTAHRVAEAFDYDVDGIVYPGVDADHFHPDVDPEIEAENPVILFVGRLIEGKGVFDLLEAVASLEGTQEIHFVGRGNRDPLRERARELGIDDAVVFHGEVPHPELPAYYAGADVFCLPSHDESFGMANIEAMACGLPVVTTPHEGIKTYLVNGENGLLARTGDPPDLADKLTMILESPELRARLGEQAREDVHAFTWRAQARRLERFCEETLEIGEGTETDDPERIRPESV